MTTHEHPSGGPSRFESVVAECLLAELDTEAAALTAVLVGTGGGPRW